jgi:hypothetical protein
MGASASSSPCHEIAEVAEAKKKAWRDRGFWFGAFSGREPES